MCFLKRISPSTPCFGVTRAKQASPLCEILWDALKGTLKDIQCMGLLYVSVISVNSNDGLSANLYSEKFMDTSLFLALNCPNKIHDFHLYFSLRLPYMPLHALTKLFESSGLNLFFFHLLDQATFRFKCLCFCTILHHFRRCFSCFLQTSDISSCTLQQNDVHWLEKVYISSACYFMCSASYIDM